MVTTTMAVTSGDQQICDAINSTLPKATHELYLFLEQT